MLEDNKNDFRKKLITLLRNQKEEERLSKSLVILDKLIKMQEYQHATTILFYASFDGEVNTEEMIKQAQQQGKTIGLPKIISAEKTFMPLSVEYVEENLETGTYGILEPKKDESKEISVEELDLVLVPGVAFDRKNYRLGRGGGYYDRFLQTLPKSIPTIGLAFDFQFINEIPQLEEHDVPVSQVLVN